MSAQPPQTLNDACEFIVDCLHATAPTEVGGYPLIRTPNIGKGRLDFTDVYRVSEETYQTWTNRAVPEPGDLILAREAPAGNVAIVKEGEKVSLGQRTVHLRPNRAKVDPDFLCYFLLAPPQQGKLLAGETGATAKHVNMKDIRRLELVGLPSLSTQRAAGSLLATYDDLIENNRRRMALLEEAARQLYREWFVRLRFPGHEHTRITNGVPEGWERKPVAELTSFLSRGIAPHYDEDADGLVINQKCIRNARLDSSLARRQSREFKPARQVQPGDVLVDSTGEGTLGRVAQVLAPIPNCTVDTHVTIVRPTPEAGVHYFGQALLEWEPRFSTMGRGATNQTELSRGQIGEVEILLPSHPLVQQFEEFATPISTQVATLMEQGRNLRAARDLLLPRLMSGEIAVQMGVS